MFVIKIYGATLKRKGQSRLSYKPKCTIFNASLLLPKDAFGDVTWAEGAQLDRYQSALKGSKIKLFAQDNVLLKELATLVRPCSFLWPAQPASHAQSARPGPTISIYVRHKDIDKNLCFVSAKNEPVFFIVILPVKAVPRSLTKNAPYLIWMHFWSEIPEQIGKSLLLLFHH